MDFVPGAWLESGGYPNLAAFIESARTPANTTSDQMIEVRGSNNLHFTFNADAASAANTNGGTLQLYACSVPNLAMSGCVGTSNSSARWVPTTSATFSLTTVNGEKVLRINAPYEKGQALIFGEVGGKVYGGNLQIRGDASSTVYFDKATANAILASISRPALP